MKYQPYQISYNTYDKLTVPQQTTLKTIDLSQRSGIINTNLNTISILPRKTVDPTFDTYYKSKSQAEPSVLRKSFNPNDNKLQLQQYNYDYIQGNPIRYSYKPDLTNLVSFNPNQTIPILSGSKTDNFSALKTEKFFGTMNQIQRDRQSYSLGSTLSSNGVYIDARSLHSANYDVNTLNSASSNENIIPILNRTFQPLDYKQNDLLQSHNAMVSPNTLLPSNFDNKKDLNTSIILNNAQETLKKSSLVRSAMNTTIPANIPKEGAYRVIENRIVNITPNIIPLYEKLNINTNNDSKVNFPSYGQNPVGNIDHDINFANIGTKVKLSNSLGNMENISNFQGDTLSTQNKFELLVKTPPPQSRLDQKVFKIETDENNLQALNSTSLQYGKSLQTPISNPRLSSTPLKNMNETKELLSMADRILKTSSQNRHNIETLISSAGISSQKNEPIEYFYGNTLNEASKQTNIFKSEEEFGLGRNLLTSNIGIINNNTNNLISVNPLTNHTNDIQLNNNINFNIGKTATNNNTGLILLNPNLIDTNIDNNKKNIDDHLILSSKLSSPYNNHFNSINFNNTKQYSYDALSSTQNIKRDDELSLKMPIGLVVNNKKNITKNHDIEVTIQQNISNLIAKSHEISEFSHIKDVEKEAYLTNPPNLYNDQNYELKSFEKNFRQEKSNNTADNQQKTLINQNTTYTINSRLEGKPQTIISGSKISDHQPKPITTFDSLSTLTAKSPIIEQPSSLPFPSSSNNQVNIFQENETSSKSTKKPNIGDKITPPGLCVPKEEKKPYFVEEIYEDGTKYIGEKINVAKHGTGKYYDINGFLYDGEWEMNKRSGFGVLYDNNGNVRYDGEWSEDKYHGNGNLYNLDTKPDKKAIQQIDHSDLATIRNQWEMYEGEFFNGKKHGMGTLYLFGGSKFCGKFKNDLVNGPGTFYFPDRTMITGEWENGHYIGEN